MISNIHRTFWSCLMLPLPICCGLSYSTMRLGPIKGYADRSNDIVCSVAKERQQGEPSDVVVFFPGDIQNYPELMTGHCDVEDIPHWNLEAVAEKLSKKMPSKDIIVVKPSRTVKGVYNHYDNFVTMNKFGAPDPIKSRFALPHLLHLIINVLTAVRPELKQKPQEEKSSPDTEKERMGDSSTIACEGSLDHPSLTNIDQNYCPVSGLEIVKTLPDFNIKIINSITLVGFSKGCVVLNQLVTEVYFMSELPEEEKQLCTSLLQKVTEMAWLDGGHQGREGTWVTNPNFVKKLVQTLPHLCITVHVTPYQMSDPNRPWIGNECRRFVAICQEASTNVTYALHGANHKRATLHTHFLALDAYGA